MRSSEKEIFRPAAAKILMIVRMGTHFAASAALMSPACTDASSANLSGDKPIDVRCRRISRPNSIAISMDLISISRHCLRLSISFSIDGKGLINKYVPTIAGYHKPGIKILFEFASMISIFPCHFQAASRLFSFLIALP